MALANRSPHTVADPETVGEGPFGLLAAGDQSRGRRVKIGELAKRGGESILVGWTLHGPGLNTLRPATPGVLSAVPGPC